MNDRHQISGGWDEQAACLDTFVVYWLAVQHLVVQVEGQVVAQQQVEQRLLPQAVVPQRCCAVQRQQLAAAKTNAAESHRVCGSDPECDVP